MATSTHAFKVAAKAVIDGLNEAGLKVYGQRRKPIDMASHEKFVLVFSSSLSGRGSEASPPIPMEMTDRVVIDVAVQGVGDEAHELELDALVDKIIDALMVAPEIWSTSFPFRPKQVSELTGEFGEIVEGEKLFLFFRGTLAFVHEVAFYGPDAPALTKVSGRKETGHGLDVSGNGDPVAEFEHDVPQ